MSVTKDNLNPGQTLTMVRNDCRVKFIRMTKSNDSREMAFVEALEYITPGGDNGNFGREHNIGDMFVISLVDLKEYTPIEKSFSQNRLNTID